MVFESEMEIDVKPQISQFSYDDVIQAFKDLKEGVYEKQLINFKKERKYLVVSNGEKQAIKRLLAVIGLRKLNISTSDERACINNFGPTHYIEKFEKLGFKIEEINETVEIDFELIENWVLNHSDTDYENNTEDKKGITEKAQNELKKISNLITKNKGKFATEINKWYATPAPNANPPKNRYVCQYIWLQIKDDEKKDEPFSISLFAKKNEQTNDCELQITLECMVNKATNEQKTYFEKFPFDDIQDFLPLETQNRRFEKKLSSPYSNDRSEEILKETKQAFDTLLPLYNKLIGKKSDNKQDDNMASLQPLNQILYGPPGTGKTYNTNKKIKEIYLQSKMLCSQDDTLNIHSDKKLSWNDIEKEDLRKYFKFITFHQSYSYEEFVEGIKPKIDNESNGNMCFELKNGIFKQLCIKANSDPEHNYILVIDEINRGNISKIFGELITLIEDNKRIIPNGKTKIKDGREELDIDEQSRADESLTVTLPYSQSEFGIPNNLYIVGTMNTADKSLALLDVALRRRFEFVAMPPDSTLLGDETKYGNKKSVLDNINNNILKALDKKNNKHDYLIGHAYFMNDEKVENILKKKVIPLLMEYFNGDIDTVEKIINGKTDKMNETGYIAKFETNNFSYKWIVQEATNQTEEIKGTPES